VTENNKIKLGDFGLATEFFKYEDKNMLSSSRKISDESRLSKISNDSNYHTKNVGTILYASPEQLNDNFYDEKSDIYSLGLILFEMLFPIKTCMEKNQRFQDLKEKRKLPEQFHVDEKLIKLILSMTDSCSQVRPSASEVNILLLEIISFADEVPNVQRKVNTAASELAQTKGYKIEIQTEDSLWTEGYVKNVKNKHLVLPYNDSPKANFIYDLNECDINVNNDGFLEVDLPLLAKINFKTQKFELDSFVMNVKMLY